LTGEVEQPAQTAILGGDDITMEEDYWPPAALLEVVEPGTVDGNKPPIRWMLPLYFSCAIGVPQRHASHGSGRRSRYDRAVSRPLCHRRLRCIRHSASDLCFSGCEADCAPQHKPSENPTNRGRFQDCSACGATGSGWM